LLGLFGVISTAFWEDLICKDVIPGSNFQLIHLGTSLFVLICGFSLILRQRRMEGASRKAYNITVVKRGIQVILIGILFAVVSSVIIYFFIGDGRYMMFNFLMMMGCSMILALPFVPLKKWAVIPAVLFIILGFLLSTINGPLYLMPLGILPGDYLPRDFFPIFPWVGIMLLGFALGSVLYPNGNRRFTIPQPNKFCRGLATIGKYPLQIYVLHIPVLAGIIFLVCLVCSLLGCSITGMF
ncbi:MAG TPA: heparan-alpha-glucosaminide N-acetyltransferase domain-containing protein, partial [Methanocorpusculum sp.]|nr:heparan-alpha-glucosaminide N-acetyltransferase domain-containing protein [Methanocorpusculum sp.]